MCSSIFAVTEWPRGGLCHLGFMTSQLQTHPCLPCFVMMELDSADYIYPLPAGLVSGSAEKTIEGLEGRKSRKGCLSFCALLPMGHREGGCEMDSGTHTTAECALPFSEDTSQHVSSSFCSSGAASSSRCLDHHNDKVFSWFHSFIKSFD